MSVPKGWKWFVATLVMGVAIGAALTYAGLELKRLQTGASAVTSPQPVPSVIATSLPVRHEIDLRIPWTGIVESSDTVELTASLQGSIEAVEAGDQTEVEYGAVVMRLGGPAVESKRTQLHAARDSLKAQLALKDQAVLRLQHLLADRLSTKEQVSSAQESQIRLRAELQDAQIALDSFEKQIHIVAPMAGVFTNRRVSQGQTVNTGDVVGEIIDTSHVRVSASLFTSGSVELAGKGATIQAGGNAVLQGAVQRVLPRADTSGATRVWIDIPQNNGRLRPGQTVNGEITLKPSTSVLTIPESAIVYDAHENPLVFVQEGNRYVRHPVGLGQVREGWVQVLAGLEQNQNVVIRGGYELFYREFSKQFQAED